jgi:hypothetical protein
MFEVNGYAKDAECCLCDKIGEALQVKCKLGTMEGNVCPKCLLKQTKVRQNARKPQPDGQVQHG